MKPFKLGLFLFWAISAIITLTTAYVPNSAIEKALHLHRTLDTIEAALASFKKNINVVHQNDTTFDQLIHIADDFLTHMSKPRKAVSRSLPVTGFDEGGNKLPIISHAITNAGYSALHKHNSMVLFRESGAVGLRDLFKILDFFTPNDPRIRYTIHRPTREDYEDMLDMYKHSDIYLEPRRNSFNPLHVFADEREDPNSKYRVVQDAFARLEAVRYALNYDSTLIAFDDITIPKILDDWAMYTKAMNEDGKPTKDSIDFLLRTIHGHTARLEAVREKARGKPRSTTISARGRWW